MSIENSSLDNLSYESFTSLAYELDLLPLFLKRYIERSSSSSFLPTDTQQTEYQKAFLSAENISDSDSLSAWLSKRGLTEEQLSHQLFFALQLKLFKLSKFNDSVDSFYLEVKSKLDRVMYSLIRCSQREKAIELYTRLTEDEDSFSNLASAFSEGYEKQVNGLIGPIELGRINLSIAERLRISRPDQIWEPFYEQGWWVILKLEKLIPSKLDSSMRTRLINDLHDNWIHERVSTELSKLKQSDFFSSLNTPLHSPISSASSSGTKRSALLSKLLNRFNTPST